LKCPKTQRYREEFLNRKWPQIREETALRKTLSVKNVTEQKRLGILAYYVKCKWEIQAKKRKLRQGEELDCI
jgi:hypothetical protein